VRRRPLLALALLALALGVAACGSAERRILDRALANPVHDADVTLRMAFSAAGTDIVRLTVAGPFHDNGPSKLASFDLRVRVAYTLFGTTQRLALRVISTGTNVMVRHAGETYQVGEDRIAQFLRRGRAKHRELARIDSLADLERFGIDLQAWFPDSRVVGDEQLGGETVTHLTGDLDVAAALQNISVILEGNTLRRQRFALTPAVIGQIENLFSDPHFDVYVAKADGSLRRVAGSVGVNLPGVPLLADARLRGTLDLRNVGERNDISAPSEGRPIEELVRGLALELGLQADPTVPAA